MPPLPKRKTAKARQGERRSHLHLEIAGLTQCPQCREPMQPHRACANCGFYRGKKVIDAASES